MIGRTNITKWRTVWIIGASSGIGAALAKSMAAEYAENVVVSARRKQQLDAIASASDRIVSLQLDITSTDSLDRARHALNEMKLKPDLVIYCAGTYRAGGLKQLSIETATTHMDVNYLGAVRTIIAARKIFTDNVGGHLALVSSLTGYCGLPKAVHYGPTKAALISLGETLKPEFDKRGWTLTVINPGFVRTPMTDQNDFPMPYLMDPDKAASAIVDGLKRRRFEIAFPAPLVRRLRMLRLLPYSLFFRITRRMV